MSYYYNPLSTMDRKYRFHRLTIIDTDRRTIHRKRHRQSAVAASHGAIIRIVSNRHSKSSEGTAEMRRIGNGIRARLDMMPDDTRICHAPDCANGTIGILELMQSERTHPGRYGAAFHWPIATDTEETANTRRYFCTSPSYHLHINGSSITLERNESDGATRRYEFTILDRDIAYLSHDSVQPMEQTT